MSQFKGLFSENKLRIPLSAYAGHIIESDCISFSKKKTTLINTIILNFYQKADSSISLRLFDYKKELTNSINKADLKQSEKIINQILLAKARDLKEKYSTRKKADLNWQITLNKKTVELLTNDPYSQEEEFYNNKPGRFIQAILEEYTQKPFYIREEIIYKQIIDTTYTAISSNNILAVINSNGTHLTLKPYCITADPLSMYHYIVGITTTPSSLMSNDSSQHFSKILSMRLSRITHAEIKHLQFEYISEEEKNEIEKEIKKKGIQFLSSESKTISVWLSDEGIKKYYSQLHLRPLGVQDEKNPHIFHFECTDSQIIYYFISFGSAAKIIAPSSLATVFGTIYKEAYYSYK